MQVVVPRDSRPEDDSIETRTPPNGWENATLRVADRRLPELMLTSPDSKTPESVSFALSINRRDKPRKWKTEYKEAIVWPSGRVA